MKGDFSTFRHKPEDNDQAVLYQQGRVTLDADLTASELIDLHWRAQAGRDVIGAGVAAVPTGDSAGFKVESAAVAGGEVRLAVHPGRVWADGILAYLPADPTKPDAAVTRVATYLEPPVNTGGPSEQDIGREVRDAVVLELALDELNAFQEPARLLEPALGGPDTAERVTTRVRFGLVRLAPGEDCTTIAKKLVDVPAGKGRLTASLAAPAPIEGDCPVVAGGGYSGMEHNLYRVEIAAADATAASFKWSQFNGGLVGRGTFTGGGTPRCVITANRTAIVSSQLTDFYLEALTFDAGLGYWQVAYGAAAKLDSEHELVLSGTQFGSVPAGPSSVFFRLWNGIAPVSAFAGAATELIDGINLAFDAEGPSATYRPGDYWTFPVRAGDVVNSAILVDGQQPQGAVLRRVPLAEISWSGTDPAAGPIEDCRLRFPPLTNLKSCCTLRVGDGNTTFGDFDSIEEAAAHLPAQGGELRLLAGTHFANLVLQGATNVAIHGCGHLTKVLPRQKAADKPIIQLAGGSSLTVRDLDLVSLFGPAIVADGTSAGPVHDIAITSCRLVARTVAIALDHAAGVVIARNRIMLLDTVLGRSAIELRASDALVERNEITTWPFTPDPAAAPGTATAGIPTKIQCAQPDAMYGVISGIVEFVEAAYLKLELAGQVAPYLAAGGIHLLGGCAGVRIVENHIGGGTGHGVALGGLLPGELTPFDPSENTTATLQVGQSVLQSVDLLDDKTGEPLAGITIYLVGADDDLVHSDTSDAGGAVAFGVPKGTYIIRTTPGYIVQKIAKSEPFLPNLPAWTFRIAKAPVEVREEQGFLYDIAIERNEIEQMALSGIGTFPFADIAFAPPLANAGDLGPFAAVLALLAPVELMRTCNVIQDLVIRDNRIHDNLLAVFDDKLSQAALSVGQGGISLALVERALIAGNRVRDNGISAVHPCCGIFIGHGEDVDVDGNEVSGNGPLPDDYDNKQKHKGIRGGIVVRFASSFLVGATAGGRQKPALRIAHNTVDQPAGRAITAFIFGPATCVSNHLNSEREGVDGLLDAVVGGVLLADLGGFQATLPTLRRGGAPDTSSLPDGALRFDDNHVRLGTDHRAAITVALATADDLGCEGNQLSSMRADAFFSSMVCLAPSVRVIGNRFREQAVKSYFSLLSVGVGFGGGSAMNTAALNQGDHCIVATSAPIGAAAIVDASNIDPDAGISGACDGVKRLDGEGELQEKLLQGLAETVDASQKSLAELQLEASLRSAIKGLGQAVLSVNIALVMTTEIEGERIVTVKGAANPFTARAHDRVSGGIAALDGLKAELQLLTIDKVAVQAGGAVVTGRVTTAKAFGLAGFGVQLVTSDGTPIGRPATSKGGGGFAVAFDADDVAKLAGKPLFVRTIDAGGTVVFEGQQALKLAPDATVEVAPIEVAVRGATPSGSGADAAPGTSTPLETIRGVGPRTAARLRAAGIADVEALMRTSAAKLIELAGKDAHVLKRHVEQARAKRETSDGDPPR